MGYEIANTADKGGAAEIRKWERLNLEKTGPIPADLFNLMASLVDNGEPSIRVFHWLKNVSDIKTQSDGSVIIYTDRATADYLPQFLGFALEQYYNTKKIATVHVQNGRNVVKYFSEPDRKRGEISQSILNAMRQAGF